MELEGKWLLMMLMMMMVVLMMMMVMMMLLFPWSRLLYGGGIYLARKGGEGGCEVVGGTMQTSCAKKKNKNK